jgi:hypothetical protein
LFEPGRQRNVFDVSFDGNKLVWKLNGQTVTATKNSKVCSPRCERDRRPDDGLRQVGRGVDCDDDRESK